MEVVEDDVWDGIDEDALLPLQHLNLPLHMLHHVLLVVELVDERCRRAL